MSPVMTFTLEISARWQMTDNNDADDGIEIYVKNIKIILKILNVSVFDYVYTRIAQKFLY